MCSPDALNTEMNEQSNHAKNKHKRFLYGKIRRSLS